jgi:fructokinase
VSKLILGYGEALLDVLPSGEVVGGAPLNFSVRAAQLCQPLGWQAALVTCLGTDPRAAKVMATLRDSLVDLTAIQVDDMLPTGFVNVSLDNGDPTYDIASDVAWDQIDFDETVAQLALRASAVCFGTLAQRSPRSRSTLWSLLDTADQAIKILDLNVRLPHPSVEIVERSLTLANVLKCNEDELNLLASWLDWADCREPRQVATRLQQYFKLDCVFWTRGARGCQLQRGEEVVNGEIPQFPRAPDADSVGAGDAASAALAVGLVAQWSPEKTVYLANSCGAFAASRSGATTALPPQILQQVQS